jgi:hypothetical protein
MIRMHRQSDVIATLDNASPPRDRTTENPPLPNAFDILQRIPAGQYLGCHRYQTRTRSEGKPRTKAAPVDPHRGALVSCLRVAATSRMASIAETHSRKLDTCTSSPSLPREQGYQIESSVTGGRDPYPELEGAAAISFRERSYNIFYSVLERGSSGPACQVLHIADPQIGIAGRINRTQ